MVFFRKQDGITNELQKQLVQRLGELSGKPATSKLHIHPVANAGRDLGGKDDEISVISSEQAKKIYSGRFFDTNKKQTLKDQWHSDITFEPIPSDYALLRLTQLPKTGGGEFPVFPFLAQPNEIQTPSGLPVTKSTTASQPHIKSFLNPSQPRTLNPASRKLLTRMVSSSTQANVEPPKMLVTSSKLFTRSSAQTPSQAGSPSSQSVITFKRSTV